MNSWVSSSYLSTTSVLQLRSSVRTVYCCLPTNCLVWPLTVMDESGRERSTALNSWYSPTYQVSTANLTLLPIMMPLHNFRPYITQSVQDHWNQTGVSLTPQPKSQNSESNPPKCTVVDFTIRVIHLERKRDAKTFILKGIGEERACKTYEEKTHWPH